MLEWILDVPKILILAGWCRVDHQSTEYFIMIRLIEPIIAKNEETFRATSSFVINLKLNM